MGRSFRRTVDLKEEGQGEVAHAASGFTYRVEAQDGKIYQVERRSGAETGRRRMDYAVGSGRHARTYLTERNGRLFELPITWYRGTGWGMTPGFDRPDQARFGRPGATCLDCHADAPRRVTGTEDRFEVPLPEGIGCERCHGPGRRHAEGASRGEAEGMAALGGLSLDLQGAVCEACHLPMHLGTGRTVVRLPREGRGPFDFRPGRPAEEVWVSFIPVDAAGVKDAGALTPAEGIAASRCFRESGGGMRCRTCHDPHAEPEAPVVYFRERCLTCHAKRPCLLSQAERDRAGDDCAGCHMARLRTPHFSFTDHRILRRPAEVEARPIGRLTLVPHRGDPSANDLGRAYMALAADDPEERSFYVGQAIRYLEEGLKQAPGSPVAWHALGMAYFHQGQTERAVEAIRKAIAQDSTRALWHGDLGQALLEAGRLREAEAACRAALRADPRDGAARVTLGNALLDMERLQEAEAAYRAALAQEPEDGEAWGNLGLTCLKQDKAAEALGAFKKALALRPGAEKIREIVRELER
jgi:Tfp pilus assembly protein PilF